MSAAPAVGLSALGVAFATMTYELTLAQALAAIYGGTVMSYSLVIGVFVLSLGLGAAFWASGRWAATGLTFLKIECVLAVLGALAPILVFRSEFGGAGFVPGAYLATGGLAFLIGALAGMEIPLLVRLADEARSGRAVSVVVGLDFLGTFAASIIVPLVFFPTIGLVGAALAASALNLVMGFGVSLSRRDRVPAWAWGSLVLMTTLLTLAAQRLAILEDYLARGVF